MPRKGRGAICFTNGNVTEYVYSASGQKLRVKHYTAVPNITRPLGVQPPELTAGQILHTDVTDYLLGGRVTMRDGRVDKVLFDGGYCQAAQAGSSSDSFAFYYYNHDHLGNIREVVDATGTVRQVTNYYPFGTPYCDSPSAQSPDLQPYKYNGKELDRMHGLDTYDYGARQYDPILARWDRVDPLCEKYYGVSPYAYCTGNPVNRIDPNGRLVIFINGFYFDFWNNIENYWNTDEGNVSKFVLSHFQDQNSMYFDGAIGGVLGISFHNEDMSNTFASTRYKYGYMDGQQVAGNIINHLSRNAQGDIEETVKIISHSMGGAYAKGFVQTLTDYAKKHPVESEGLKNTEYDFAPFQPEHQTAVNGVDTYQYSHKNDKIAGNRKIQDAHMMNTSNIGDHSLKTFIQYVWSLPEGRYSFHNGLFIKE